MKCQKCNFISFDYNQACPKCGNDLSQEKDLMNFPSYKPAPPSLLGALTGEIGVTDDDAMIPHPDASAEGAEAEELLISLDNLSPDAPESMQFEPEVVPAAREGDMEAGEGDALEELSISLDDLSGEDEPIQLEPEAAPATIEKETEVGGGEAPEELSISLDDLSDQESIPFEPETTPAATEKEMETGDGDALEELSISLDDLSDEESIPFEPEAAAATEKEIADELIVESDLTLSEEAESKKDAFWDARALEETMADMKFDNGLEEGGTPPPEDEEPLNGAKEKESFLDLELEPLELDIELEESDKKAS